jgi:hypothetical protein
MSKNNAEKRVRLTANLFLIQRLYYMEPVQFICIHIFNENGGADRDRTDDLLLAKQALSQLSYGPFRCGKP